MASIYCGSWIGEGIGYKEDRGIYHRRYEGHVLHFINFRLEMACSVASFYTRFQLVDPLVQAIVTRKLQLTELNLDNIQNMTGLQSKADHPRTGYADTLFCSATRSATPGPHPVASLGRRTGPGDTLQGVALEKNCEQIYKE